ncbi:hypothetical protein FSARC_11953 [Fusarium sarcochroum]|uniref:Uncharacterized protein n=1 Tax=Fusarium sarcochroum TaxID=1208366 RepID=A0A8H4TBY6_9HYPO|nr:hypothetical protein FSARC_11953 [Fusarium sarcochroum]
MTFDDDGHLLHPADAKSSNTLLSDFDSYCFTATMLVEKGRPVKFRRAISKATALIGQILLAEHPRTLSCFFEVFIHLIQTGLPSAASYFCRYIKTISEKFIRNDNVWGQICGLLGELESTSLDEAMARVWECITAIFERNLGALNRFAVSVRLDYIKRVNTDHLEEEQQLNNLLTQFKGVPTRATPRVMLNLAHNLNKQGRHHEAEKKAREVWLLLEAHDTYTSRVVERIECLKIISHSLFHRGRTYKEEAENTMRQAIMMITNTLGTEHAWVAEFKNVLEDWLRTWDQEEDADILKDQVGKLIGKDEVDE